MAFQKKVKPCCAPSRGDLTGRTVLAQQTKANSLAGASGDHDEEPNFVTLRNPTFRMGNDDVLAYPSDGEGPIRDVTCDSYEINAFAVSNERYKIFVDETNYVSDAEKCGWSFVFHLLIPPDKRAGLSTPAGLPWWLQVRGAHWAAPEGPGSDIKNRMAYPVTHVSWNDANAYCEWSNTRLPSEAEWECAARGGLEGKRYSWGNDLCTDNQHRCNIWQGTFPKINTGDDGYLGTAPVYAYQPNGLGLYNVCGNVWEWCADWFSPNYHRVTRAENPIYLIPTGSRSIRGGSFLCHESWCNRYRVAARTSISPDTSTSHCGFRVVKTLLSD